MAEFPTAIYTERETQNLPGIVYDPTQKQNLFSEDFQRHAEEIIAIETFLETGGVREKLTANRTYYIRTDGNNTNNGLANTSGGAFLTLQHAWNVIVTLDLSGFIITLQLGDGTYTGALLANVPVIGGSVIINGNVTRPANVVLALTYGGGAIEINCPSYVTLQNFKITNSIAYGVVARFGARVYTGTGMEYGACVACTFRVDNGGYIGASVSFTVTGNSSNLIVVLRGGVLEFAGGSCTFVGTPAYSYATVEVDSGGIINFYRAGFSFSGGATGKRYTCVLNGVINTFGGGANFIPGNVAGTLATGGQYA